MRRLFGKKCFIHVPACMVMSHVMYVYLKKKGGAIPDPGFAGWEGGKNPLKNEILRVIKCRV